MKIRNIVFSALICIFLCGPAALWVAQERTLLNLPTWFTAEDARYLSGGISKAEVGKNLNLEGFANEKLQSALESKIGNYVPIKARALLTNAGIQRKAIDLSNSFFNWDCYPTYYGSAYIFLPEQSAIATFPAYDRNCYDRLDSFCEPIATYAKEHSTLRIKIYLADMSSTSKANPAAQYVSRVFFTQDAVDYIKNHLEDCSNIQVYTDTYTNPAEYYSYYFRSDHHWNARGALRAFETMGNQTDPECGAIFSQGFRDVEGPLYSGSYMRAGLCPAEDKPFDLAYKFDNIALENNNSSWSGEEHELYYSADKLKQQYQFYDLYFNATPWFKNKKPASSNAIIVIDSFGCALARPLSTEYDATFCTTALAGHNKTDLKLSEIDDNSHDVTDVIFVGCLGNYLSFVSRNPHFFE